MTNEQARMDAMFARQFYMQTEVYGNDLPEYTISERVAFIDLNIFAAVDELHEAAAEMGWKPWATSSHVNVDRLQSELIDVWHFLMNLGLVVGIGNYQNLVAGVQAAAGTARDEPLHRFLPAAIMTEFLNIEERVLQLRQPGLLYESRDYRTVWGGALHYFLRVARRLDMTTEFIYSKYMVKSQVNVQRQLDGYDGVTGKCVQCHRDLKEAPQGAEVGFCGLCSPVLEGMPGATS